MSEAADVAPVTAGPPAAGSGGILRRLWAGQVPLGQAFWSFAMLGGTALNLATTLLAMALLAMDLPGILVALIFVLPIPYNVLLLVAVWRSAAAYAGPRLWADLARLTIVAWALIACVA